MCNTLQVGCHLDKLYAEYVTLHHNLVELGAKAHGPPMTFDVFRCKWNKWCDRYVQGAGFAPEIWGEAFLQHEAGPLV